jgi:diguanylate cyclase (GGDEF)-like protein
MPSPPEPGTSHGGDPLLQAALSSMPYGFSVWDEDWRLALYNQAYLDLYGFAEPDVHVGMSLREMGELTIRVGNHPGFTPEEICAHFAMRLRAAEPGKVFRSQKVVRDRIIKTNHIRNPGIGWIVTHEDVSEDAEEVEKARQRDTALTQQNARFEAAIGNMPHGLSMYDAERRLVVCNQAYAQMYDMPAELIAPGTSFDDIINYRKESGARIVEVERGFVEDLLAEPLTGEQGTQTYRLKNGRMVVVVTTPTPEGGFVATHQDVTADLDRIESLKAGQRELASQNMRLDAAVNNISQGLCMFDAEQKLVICNEQYARIYDLPPSLLVPGTTLTEILEHRFAHGMLPVGGRDAYLESRRALVNNRLFAKDVIEMENGRAIAVRHHPMPDGGWVATHEDITEQRQIEARVRHLARHDPLTDLPNRILFREEMEKAEARIKRGEVIAVLCVDLDHFKTVNDTLGHGVGDSVLGAVAQRLREASRETDHVARLGGDEFAILAGGLDDPNGAATIAARIVKSVAKPIVVDEQQILIGASVGIAVAPLDGTDGETLLKKADLALYRAKGEGRGNYHFFEKGMDEALQERRALEQGLRHALGRGEFRLAYQPLVDVRNNRICCVEALLRWDHPERGVIQPSDFIPIAEETGVIGAIGEWVLREACHTAARWPDDIHIAVNLSPVQFKNRALVNQVTSALQEANLDPARLELEITESLLLADTTLTLETLHRLRALGVRISMDDFGTGYSSLSYLRSFPFDKIKIDRTFMKNLRPGEDSMAIIKAVIGLGRSLGMSTTAEGIETEEQLNAVKEQGCDEVQGFLFSPPLPASGIDSLVGTVSPDAVPRQKQAS